MRSYAYCVASSMSRPLAPGGSDGTDLSDMAGKYIVAYAFPSSSYYFQMFVGIRFYSIQELLSEAQLNP
jgi:hypothetical protein